jgi:peptidoglycan hydrolase-like protein with peptidoglycan-binding domain
MVQPKYSPEEALQRIKLMMEYDLSKTSTENKKVVLEQTTDLTIDDIKNGKSVIKLGMKGPIVGQIQELLISAGYPNISKSGKIDNDFGSLTKGEVEKFQTDNVNDKGEALQKDGKVGPETIKALLKKSDVKMRTAAGAVKTDRLTPKEFGQIPKTTQPVSQQTQTSSDPFACVKNYYTLKNIKFQEGTGGDGKYIRFYLTEKITWTFNLENDKYIGNIRYWYEQDGNVFDTKKGFGKWKCDGESNFIIDKADGTIYRSSDSNAQQTVQPVSQQTQSVSNSTQDTELAAGYSDPNQQSTLRRRDSPLDDILKNQDINKSACRKNISDYFNAWRTRSVVPDDIQQASKNIVQQCANQNYGKFGIGGGKFDEMLDVLTGNHPSGIKQYGDDKQWRIQKPITIQNTRRK